MQSAASSVLPKHLQKGLLFGVLVALALVFAGRLFAPAMSLFSTTAASVTLLAYGVIAALCSATFVGTGNVLRASLGYYLAPVVNVPPGGERPG